MRTSYSPTDELEKEIESIKIPLNFYAQQKLNKFKSITDKCNLYGKNLLNQYFSKTKANRSSNRENSKPKLILNISPIHSKEKIEIEAIEKIIDSDNKAVDLQQCLEIKEKLDKKIQKRKEEMEKLIYDKNYKELKECTFKPNINRKSLEIANKIITEVGFLIVITKS